MAGGRREPKGRTLVVGYGNTLRGDDGAGPRVAAAVALWRRPGVESLAVHQLTPELAARLVEVDRVIFVDARIAAAPSETCEVREIVAADDRGPDGHSCDPRALLSMADRLFGARPRALSVTIPAIDLAFGERLSGPADREVRAALGAIHRLLTPDGDRSARPARGEGGVCTSSA
jgi:hydrogenase maturation protease